MKIILTFNFTPKRYKQVLEKAKSRGHKTIASYLKAVLRERFTPFNKDFITKAELRRRKAK